MVKKWYQGVLVLTLVVAMGLSAKAQESAVKGNIDGVVVDASGASVPGATVTLTGPTGTKSTTADQQGIYSFTLLIPGMYTVKIQKQGFKTASVNGVEVLTNKTSSLRTELETGTITETIEVSGSAIMVDTSSTAIGANLNDNFYEKIPIPRGVAGLFYLAPGVASGGASGAANPSISGGSGLENQYVADGVDITDSAFGGLGIFSRVYGSLGTGINLAFIKEVEVKTGGYEPQYGKSTGGIVQIVTKTGGNQYHGELSAFFAPQALEANHTNPDDPQFAVVNQTGRLLHNEGYDIYVGFGGYVPKLKDKLFFFAGFDPSLNDQFTHFPTTSPLYSTKDTVFRTYTYNYMGKLTWKLSDKHQFESSVFGDPSHTSTSNWDRLTTYSDTARSKLNYGNRDWSLRYNGTLSPTWQINISGAWGYNHFNETGFPVLSEIIDQTGPELGLNTRPQFTSQGRGFVEPTEDNTYKLNADTSKTVHKGGDHTFSVGYGWEKAGYKGGRQYSGGAVPVPGVNADGTALNINSAVPGQLANAEWYLRVAGASCTKCPLMTINDDSGNPMQVPVYLRMLRSEFGVDSNGIKHFTTSSKYHSAYVNDSWTINKYITLNLGVRWDQEFLRGEATKYTFTDNWSPRIGISIDPTGTRKNKIYANFARYNYNFPLDLAERSLTNELDLFSFRLAPDYTVNASGQRIINLNQYGGASPIFDAAHVLNGATGGTGSKNITSSVQSTEAIQSGTRMMYEDEWVAGYEHEFKSGVIVTAKFVRRDLKRIVEDTGGVSPEAANAGFQQVFLIGNIHKNTDLFTNPVPTEWTATTDATGNITNIPAACVGYESSIQFPVVNSLNQPVATQNGATAVCFGKANYDASGNPIAGLAKPDGKPDGFVDPIRRYTAVEIEANKSFSKNWQMRANWRIARLSGNYEGALRNDNGQTDPGISSLFDFTTGDFNLLGDQFLPGVLNTDRLHIVNGFFTYVFDHTLLKGMQLGTGVRIQTGTPINRLAAHPIYLNAGEVPLGGRGSEGRTPTTGAVDFHASLPIRLTERLKLDLGADLFNIGFAKRIQYVNQNIDLGFGTTNVDFLKPGNQNGVRINDSFQTPFSARLFLRLSF
jgi:Carboxypeptidase regulatory-like domain/TonB-dependent Receptor Plug Domain